MDKLSVVAPLQFKGVDGVVYPLVATMASLTMLKRQLGVTTMKEAFEKDLAEVGPVLLYCCLPKSVRANLTFEQFEENLPLDIAMIQETIGLIFTSANPPSIPTRPLLDQPVDQGAENKTLVNQ